MQLNGVKTFKIETVGDTGTPPAPTPEEAQTQQEAQQQLENIENYFTGPTGTGQNTPPPNTVGANDYTFGDIQGDAVGTSFSSSNVSSWLQEFPPPLEEILVGNENAINYLDIILARYTQAKDDLLRLQQAYQLEIDSGEATASRTEELTSLMRSITSALVRSDQQIQNVDDKARQSESIFLDEIRAMKDLNGDSWIGRPLADGSYYVKEDEEGNTVYYDPKTKQAIANPLMDPEYEPILWENSNVTRVEKPDGYEPPEGEVANVYYQLDPSKLGNGSGDYGAVLDFAIPEYMWVERDGNGSKLDVDENGTGGMALYDEWDANGQKVPSDLSRYMEVQVTDVVVTSKYSGVSDDNDQRLFDTVIELRNDSTLIARIRVEGTTVTGGSIGPAADTGSGKFVAASSVGLSLNGNRRASPIKIDASGYTSTGRHVLTEEQFTALGLEEPDDVGNARAAYNHNLDAFRPNKDGVDNYDGGSADAYVAANTTAPEDDGDWTTSERLGVRTGIFVSGVRGDIKGTSSNDIIKTTGVNEYSAYGQDHMPANRKPIVKDDAFYSNKIDANRGNNIVITGAGDNYVFGATFFWGENEDLGEDYIALQEIRPLGGEETDTPSSTSRNPQSFVHATGAAQTYFYNPAEHNIAVTEDIDEADGDAVFRADAEYSDDDYFFISGTASAFAPDDEDFDPSTGRSSGDADGSNLEYYTGAANDAMAGWYEELTKVPAPDESEAPVNWDEINGQQTALGDEMNSFFDTMFGEMDGFLTESDGETGQDQGQA